MSAVVLDMAYVELRRVQRDWPDDRIPGVGYPFGNPDGMPPHRWRVSWDVMQALTEAAPPPAIPNPKTSEGFVKLLFGWPIEVDRGAPAGTLKLVPAGQP
jgi:hypothetical protein